MRYKKVEHVLYYTVRAKVEGVSESGPLFFLKDGCATKTFISFFRRIKKHPRFVLRMNHV